ncbi:MAG: SusD/RagB family nutrient-binding outer membrane lipoprotein [Bacteroidales bacterium]|nr:SusD/RagB family nutrient-binding outer membrane lipoprotein [Bacteroidales bacterium]
MKIKAINMKIKYLLALLIIATVSCTKGFEELNTPPASTVSLDPGILLSTVQVESNYEQGMYSSNISVGAWIQHWNSSLIVPTSRYIYSHGDWTAEYGRIKNITQIRNTLLAGEETTPKGRTKLAIAKIVEIDLWQDITDKYGDIPFSQSGLGEENLIAQPKYDTQESVYTKLIQDIDVAISNLNATDDSYKSADLYYGGNVEKWIKYGNSIKLQLGMRLKYVAPALAKATVEAALSSSLISSNADNALIQTSTEVQQTYNPILNQLSTGATDLRYLGEALVSQLVKTNDPRLPLIADPTINSVKDGNPKYVGKPAAQTEAQMVGIINDDYSTASTLTYFNMAYNNTNPIPQYVFTYAEICFYKAEAALESWGGLTPAQAEGFYQDGIRAAMALKPYNITTIPQSYIDSEFSFAGLTSEQKLEKIMTQKWILFFGRNNDAFSEWRRTGYPKLIPGPNPGSTNGKIPRRSGYPASEALLNATNYNEVVSRMSDGDSYLTKVWWDAKTK